MATAGIPPQDQAATANAYHAGLRALRAGQVAAGVASLRQVVAEDPGHVAAHTSLGAGLQALGHPDAALAQYEQAIALDPAWTEAHVRRAGLLRLLGRAAEALAAYDRLLAVAPDLAAAHHDRGGVLRLLDRPAEAIASFDQAIALRADFPAAHYNRASASLAMGDVAAAIASYHRAIALRPDFVEALCGLGDALLAQPDHAAALACFDRTLALRPEHAAAHAGRGAALLGLGRAAEALAAYDQAVRAEPDHSDHHHNRAIALFALARPAEAVESCDRALALRGDFAMAHHHRGVALAALDRTAEAVESFGRAIALRPDLVEAHYNQGLALHALTRHQDAAESHGRAIALKPDLADAHYGRGVALQAAERFADALTCFDRVIELVPDRAEAHGNRARVLRELGRSEQAEAAYDRALALRPDYAEAYNDRGDLLLKQDRIAEALADFDAALDLRPGYADALLNRAIALRQMMRLTESAASAEAAIAARPDFALAHLTRAVDLLALGRLEEGWREYEWRKRIDKPVGARIGPEPLWLNDRSLDGKTLLIHAEQGLGDTIQFCRYLALLPGTLRVVFAMRRPLLRLLRGLHAAVTVVDEAAEPPPFDLHCPLLSLPLAFGTTLATIPANVPYLHADMDEAAIWRARLADLPGLRVGLCWAGNPSAILFDRRRSMTLAELVRLAIPGVSLVSLQKGPAAAQAAAPPSGMVIHDWTDALKDFADTAALISALDLVITVDTAVAHVAGALGRPVWILNRFDACWRWLTDRTDSPWYPTARLFRQPAPGDWDSVVIDVADSLRVLAVRPPGEAMRRFQYALGLHRQGRLEDARAEYNAILDADPAQVDAMVQLGVIALQTGHADDSVALLRRAIAGGQVSPTTHYTLALALQALGEHGAALASDEAAIALRPEYADAHYHRGVMLTVLERLEAAIASYDRAIALAPGYADAFNNRGSAWLRLGRHAAALADFAQAIALKPDFAEAYSNRGSALRELERYEESLDSYGTAIALRPDQVAMQFNRGNVLAALGRHAEAVASYDRALTLQPGHGPAQYRRACSLLSLGRFAEGWRAFEARRRLDPSLRDRPDSPPAWLGEAKLAGRTLLVRAEGGFGDTIQFCRYLPPLTQDGHIVLAAPDPLLRLLRGLHPAITLIGPDDPPPAFDLQCPMLSLPLASGTTLETIPAPVPYLYADPAATDHWRARLAGLDGLRVGLCWAGNPGQPSFPDLDRTLDRRRSVTLSRLTPLAFVPGISLVSLQKGPAAAQLQAPPPFVAVHDWTAELADFADTAALIAALDLVITVDTAVAHLAGALGTPVWVLNRFDACWRWLTDRTDSPWYPSARLFRQAAPGAWDEVIARVATALREHVA